MRVQTNRNRRRVTGWGTGLALALLVGVVPCASAQVVSGLLLEAGSDAPVGFGEISALDDSGDIVASGFSDGNGAFSLKLKRGGNFTLYAVRLGYFATVSESIFVDAGQEVSVAVRLQAAPLEVDSLTVEVEARIPRLGRVGFYNRAKMGVGYHLDRIQIQDMVGVRTLPDVIRETPGVRLTMDSFGKQRVLLRNTMGGSCVPMLILDGIAINPPWESLVDAPDVDGVEVYARPTQVPVEFQALVPSRDNRYGSSAAQCGLVVAWSRSGDRGR